VATTAVIGFPPPPPPGTALLFPSAPGASIWATAFWLRNTALLSKTLAKMAPAKARDSIALPIVLFPHKFPGGIPICIAHAKTVLDRRAGSIDRAAIAEPLQRSGPWRVCWPKWY
jgi:hypothetical protein